MSTVYFRGVSFESLGLIVKRKPVPPASTKVREAVIIPDGATIIDTSTEMRNPIEFPIECTMLQPRNKLRELYALIQEEGALILSDEENKYYYASISIEEPENIILHYHNITFNVVAEPYAYAVSNAERVCSFTTEGDHKVSSITNRGTAYCLPAYRFKAASAGTLSLWLDDARKISVSVSANEVITIDLFHNTVISNGYNVAYKIVGDYSALKLAPGENSIKTINCSELNITLNERWY